MKLSDDFKLNAYFRTIKRQIDVFYDECKNNKTILCVPYVKFLLQIIDELSSIVKDDFVKPKPYCKTCRCKECNKARKARKNKPQLIGGPYIQWIVQYMPADTQSANKTSEKEANNHWQLRCSLLHRGQIDEKLGPFRFSTSVHDQESLEFKERLKKAIDEFADQRRTNEVCKRAKENLAKIVFVIPKKENMKFTFLQDATSLDRQLTKDEIFNLFEKRGVIIPGLIWSLILRPPSLHPQKFIMRMHINSSGVDVILGSLNDFSKLEGESKDLKIDAFQAFLGDITHSDSKYDIEFCKQQLEILNKNHLP